MIAFINEFPLDDDNKADKQYNSVQTAICWRKILKNYKVYGLVFDKNH